MEAERVKTKKVSAADRIPEKTGRKKWSVLFLESLLKEAKEREAESEKARPAVDGESWIRPGRDTFEHSEDPEELWCESYEDIRGVVRMVGKWKANILYQIANAILRDYHEKKLDEDGVGELFGLCCQKCKDTGGGTGRKTEPQITETVLEFFLRANARMSVFSMERAGKRLTARCGLSSGPAQRTMMPGIFTVVHRCINGFLWLPEELRRNWERWYLLRNNWSRGRSLWQSAG